MTDSVVLYTFTKTSWHNQLNDSRRLKSKRAMLAKISRSCAISIYKYPLSYYNDDISDELFTKYGVYRVTLSATISNSGEIFVCYNIITSNEDISSTELDSIVSDSTINRRRWLNDVSDCIDDNGLDIRAELEQIDSDMVHIKWVKMPQRYKVSDLGDDYKKNHSDRV